MAMEQPKFKKDRFLSLLELMRETYKKKNAGYAGVDAVDPFRNFRFSELFNITPFQGCLVRMSDKFIRVSNLSKNEKSEQVGENIKDTLLDLAVYSLIAICLYEEREEEKS